MCCIDSLSPCLHFGAGNMFFCSSKRDVLTTQYLHVGLGCAVGRVKFMFMVASLLGILGQHVEIKHDHYVYQALSVFSRSR